MGQSFTFLAPKTPAEMFSICCCCHAKSIGEKKTTKSPFLAPSNIQGNGLDGEFKMTEGFMQSLVRNYDLFPSFDCISFLN